MPANGGGDGSSSDSGSTDSGVDWSNSFSGWFSGLGSSIVEGLTKPLQAIKDSISSAVSSIINGFTNALKTLFLPSETYFSDKIKPIEDKFKFALEFIDLAKHIVALITNGDVASPSFTLDLSAANTKYALGNSVTISFDWYAPYRDTVNRFLSGFIWLGFIWRTFKGLPGIISGSGVSDVADMTKGGGSD